MRAAAPLVLVIVALAAVLVLVVAAKAILRSQLPRSLRLILLALESLVGAVVSLIAIAGVTLSMGYWPFPWGPDGP